MKETKKFDEFLNYTFGQKEVSLAVINDLEEFEELSTSLQEKGFVEAKNDLDFFQNIRDKNNTFFFVTEGLPKKIYDIIVQFPTGQIEIFDDKKMETQVIKPDRSELSVLILLTEGSLKEIENSGYFIIDKVGLTYRK